MHSGSFFSSFSFLILTLFSLYALSTLHPSPFESLQHALSIPHDSLIKPYVIPSLRAALSHSTVEPHVTNLRTTVQPYTERIGSGARPVLVKLSELERKHMRPLVRRGTKASYSLVRKIWQRTVIPSYNSYLRPHIQPYQDRWDLLYYSKIDPPLRAIIDDCKAQYYNLKPRIETAQRNARRYTEIAYSEVAPRAHHFYKSVQPHMITLWTQARPHIITGWKFLRFQAIKGASALRIYVAMAAVRLGDARREFVDPHVKQIWEKVESRSSTSVEATPSTASANITPVTSPALPKDEPTSTATFEASSVSETLAATPFPESSENIVESYIAVTRSLTSDKPPKAAASIIAESAGLGVAAEVVIADSIDEEAAMDQPVPPVMSQAEFSISEVPETSPTESQTNAAPLQSSVVSEGEENIDDFLLQLGITSNEQSSTEQSSTEQLDTADDDEHRLFVKQEAEATRRAETAAKRANIVLRHANWQAQLDELFAARERDLRRALVNIRKRAIEELKGLTVHYGRENKHAKAVDSIEQMAGQLVKGVEAYLKKERERKEKVGRKWNEEIEDRKNQWMKVMDKVDEKYEESVNGILEQVQRWYIGVKEMEVNEVSWVQHLQLQDLPLSGLQSFLRVEISGGGRAE